MHLCTHSFSVDSSSRLAGKAAELVPVLHPPITSLDFIHMELSDEPQQPGLAELGIQATSIEDIALSYLKRYRFVLSWGLCVPFSDFFDLPFSSPPFPFVPTGTMLCTTCHRSRSSDFTGLTRCDGQ